MIMSGQHEDDSWSQYNGYYKWIRGLYIYIPRLRGEKNYITWLYSHRFLKI